MNHTRTVLLGRLCMNVSSGSCAANPLASLQLHANHNSNMSSVAAVSGNVDVTSLVQFGELKSMESCLAHAVTNQKRAYATKARGSKSATTEKKKVKATAKSKVAKPKKDAKAKTKKRVVKESPKQAGVEKQAKSSLPSEVGVDTPSATNEAVASKSDLVTQRAPRTVAATRFGDNNDVSFEYVEDEAALQEESGEVKHHSPEFFAIQERAKLSRCGIASVSSRVVSQEYHKTVVEVVAVFRTTSPYVNVAATGGCGPTITATGRASANAEMHAEGKACRRLAADQSAMVRNIDELLMSPSELEYRVEELVQSEGTSDKDSNTSRRFGGKKKTSDRREVKVFTKPPVECCASLTLIPSGDPSRKEYTQCYSVEVAGRDVVITGDPLATLLAELRHATTSATHHNFNANKGSPTPNVVLNRALMHYFGIHKTETLYAGEGPFVASVMVDKNILEEKGIKVPHAQRLIEIGRCTSTTKKNAARGAFVDALSSNFPEALVQVAHLPNFNVEGSTFSTSVRQAVPSGAGRHHVSFGNIFAHSKMPLVFLTDLVRERMPDMTIERKQFKIQNRLWVSQLQLKGGSADQLQQTVFEGVHQKKDTSVEIAAVKALSKLFPTDAEGYLDIAIQAGLMDASQSEQQVSAPQPPQPMVAFRCKPSESLLSVTRSRVQALVCALGENRADNADGAVEEICRIVASEVCEDSGRETSVAGDGVVQSLHEVDVSAVFSVRVGAGQESQERQPLSTTASRSLLRARLDAYEKALQSDVFATLSTTDMQDVGVKDRQVPVPTVAAPPLVENAHLVQRFKQWMMFLYGQDVHAITNQREEGCEVQLWAEAPGGAGASSGRTFVSVSFSKRHQNVSQAIRKAYSEACDPSRGHMPAEALHQTVAARFTSKRNPVFARLHNPSAEPKEDHFEVLELPWGMDTMSKNCADAKLGTLYGISENVAAQELHRYIIVKDSSRSDGGNSPTAAVVCLNKLESDCMLPTECRSSFISVYYSLSTLEGTFCAFGDTEGVQGPLFALSCSWSQRDGKDEKIDQRVASVREFYQTPLTSTNCTHAVTFAQALVKMHHGLPLHCHCEMLTGKGTKWVATVAIPARRLSDGSDTQLVLGKGVASSKKNAVKMACRVAIERNFPRDFKELQRTPALGGIIEVMDEEEEEVPSSSGSVAAERRENIPFSVPRRVLKRPGGAEARTLSQAEAEQALGVEHASSPEDEARAKHEAQVQAAALVERLLNEHIDRSGSTWRIVEIRAISGGGFDFKMYTCPRMQERDDVAEVPESLRPSRFEDEVEAICVQVPKQQRHMGRKKLLLTALERLHPEVYETHKEVLMPLVASLSPGNNSVEQPVGERHSRPAAVAGVDAVSVDGEEIPMFV